MERQHDIGSPKVGLLQRLRSRLTRKRSATSKGGTICEVPVELIIAIFCLCGVRSVVKCRAVSQQFRIIIDHTPRLQYMIELEIAGYDENICRIESTLVPERLRLLGEYQSLWKTARFISRDVSAPFMWDPHTDALYGGNLFIRPGPSIPQSRVLFCQCFTSSESGEVLVKSWKIETQPFNAFAPLPEHDIVAILSRLNHGWKIRLISLSDGSLRKSIQLFGLDWRANSLCDIKSEGHILIIAMKGYGRVEGIVELFLFDSMTGSLVAKLGRRYGFSRMLMTKSFMFISSTYFILGVSCKADRSRPGFYAIHLYSMEDMMIPTNGVAPAPRHVATFQLPVFQDRCLLGNNMIFEKTIQDSFAREQSTTPFFMASCSAMLRIYGISATRAGVNGQASVIIYLHLSTFFELLASKKVGRLHSPEFYPWETWGPKYTRCFDTTNHTDDLYAGYGTRIVHNDLLLDFNQSSLMRELHRIQPSGESSNAGSSSTLKFRRGKLKLSHKAALSQPATDNTDPAPHRIVTDPTIIPRGQFFEKDIESSLPYRETPISWHGNVRPHAIYGNEVWIAEANRDPATGLSTYQTLYPACS